jgi:hypothetical protein
MNAHQRRRNFRKLLRDGKIGVINFVFSQVKNGPDFLELAQRIIRQFQKSKHWKLARLPVMKITTRRDQVEITVYYIVKKSDTDSQSTSKQTYIITTFKLWNLYGDNFAHRIITPGEHRFTIGTSLIGGSDKWFILEGSDPPVGTSYLGWAVTYAECRDDWKIIVQ